jgi:hypothetical protein|tara:strand:+ start:128 stop:658 length:531 start_codon:yes stop_codon:yes gene_type:complete
MLAELIRRNVKEPLSIEMLGKVVPKWCRVSFYDKLAKYRTLAQALQGAKCMIVLYNIHDRKKNTLNKAGHFILINNAGKKVEYFSSSGWSVAKELDVTRSDPNIFKRLLGNTFIQNTVALEKQGDSNDCWRFCLARAILADMPLRQFLKLFSNHIHLKNADEIVTLMTMLYISALG